MDPGLMATAISLPMCRQCMPTFSPMKTAALEQTTSSC